MPGFPLKKIGLTSTPVEILPHPGRILDGTIFNHSNLQAFVLFYDKHLADVTVGTTPAYWFAPVSPSDNDSLKAGGLVFLTAITVAAVDAPDGSTSRTVDLALTVT